jgi:hypothetical protein
VKLKPKWDELSEFTSGLAAATINGAAGYIRANGDWAFEPRYDNSYRLFGDLGIVKREKSYFYIRPNGAAVWRSEPHAYLQRRVCD